MAVNAGEVRERLDIAVVDQGLADTRSRARAMILAGDVLVNGVPEHHAGSKVGTGDELSLKSRPRFVGRGGEKLDFALESFSIDVSGTVCADVGASTGGFTDCLLQRGAKRVYAIDVGYGQLDGRLRDDGRVVIMERVNARYVEKLPEQVDLAVIDVSFISLKLILPVVWQLLGEVGTVVPLIKPQFEAGKRDVGRGGVVKDPEIHRKVLETTLGAAEDIGFTVLGLVRSPLVGPAGNVEFLAHLEKGKSSRPLSTDHSQLICTVLPG